MPRRDPAEVCHQVIELARSVWSWASTIPALERLIRVARGLDIELMIDIRPKDREARLPRKRALEASSFSSGDCEIVLATA